MVIFAMCLLKAVTPDSAVSANRIFTKLKEIGVGTTNLRITARLQFLRGQKYVSITGQDYAYLTEKGQNECSKLNEKARKRGT